MLCSVSRTRCGLGALVVPYGQNVFPGKSRLTAFALRFIFAQRALMLACIDVDACLGNDRQKKPVMPMAVKFWHGSCETNLIDNRSFVS